MLLRTVLVAVCLRRIAASVAATTSTVAAASVDPLEDCLEVPSAFCLTGASGAQQVVVSPTATTSDLVLWYQFDKSLPVDDSGHKLHLVDEYNALSALPVGPGLLGRGGSADFDGRLRRIVKGNEALSTEAFTVTLWLYLREDSVGGWRTIFSKGSNPEQLTPALLLRPDERRLHVRASPAGAEGGALDGSGLLPLRRWTHIAVVCAGSVLRLYVNGLKDAEAILENPPSIGAVADLHIGRDPWRAGTKAYLDDFRWYNRALAPSEIKALTFPSLTGMGSDFVKLGCPSCRYTEAVNKCGTRFHLCSVQELFAGALHTARAMGWLSASPEVWYHTADGEVDMQSGNDIEDLGWTSVLVRKRNKGKHASFAAASEDHFGDTLKLGLCCAN